MPFPKKQNVDWLGWSWIVVLINLIIYQRYPAGIPVFVAPGHAEPHSKKLVFAEVARILEAFPERSELTTVGGIPTPLKKYELVSCSQYMGKYGKLWEMSYPLVSSNMAGMENHGQSLSWMEVFIRTSLMNGPFSIAIFDSRRVCGRLWIKMFQFQTNNQHLTCRICLFQPTLPKSKPF